MALRRTMMASNSVTPGAAWYSTLFLAGDVGMVFDANDLTRVFQDTSHVNPCTAAGQNVGAIRDVRTGAYLTTNYGAPTLGFDATKARYYIDLPSTANLAGVGVVPSALGGDNPITLIAVCDFPATSQFGSVYIGPDYPANPSSGNAIFLGKLNDPSLVLDFLQFGTGRGVQAASAGASGLGVVMGVKNGASGSTHQLDLYNTSKSKTISTGVTTSNITALNFNIGRALGAGKVYCLVAINRVLTSTEINYVYANALT